MPIWQRPAQREGKRECGDDQNDQFENWLYTIEEEKEGRREKACTRSWSGGSAPVFQISEGVDGSRGDVTGTGLCFAALVAARAFPDCYICGGSIPPFSSYPTAAIRQSLNREKVESQYLPCCSIGVVG